MKKSKYLIFVLIALIIFIIANNCSILPVKNKTIPELLAHRGLAQTFDIEKVQWDTNTAAMIHAPEHTYIENTIPSMKIAFDNGADIVEFDIRITKDKELAVFHDYTVESRTEKKGKVSDYKLVDLKKMDIGYGYTHDNGKTFPLRNKGVGLLPSFDDVINEFPDKKFLVHIRDEGEEIGILLLAKLNGMNKDQINNISIYGNDEAIRIIKQKYLKMKALSARIIKRALIEYELIGWSGYIPTSIRDAELHVPIEYAQFLWGWPNIFISRMNKVNTRIVIVRKKGQWSGGFDSIDDLKDIPENYFGCIWTERIDKIGKYYKKNY